MIDLKTKVPPLLDLATDVAEYQQQQFQKSFEHIATIEKRMAELQAFGMYPAVPIRGEWQSREKNGPRVYFYMVFSTDRKGSYTGPGGKQKIYIGTDPDKVREARQLAANRIEFNELQAELERVQRWLNEQHRAMQQQRQSAATWPRMAGLMGLEPSALRQYGVRPQRSDSPNLDALAALVASRCGKEMPKLHDLAEIIGELSDVELFNALSEVPKAPDAAVTDNDQSREAAAADLERALGDHLWEMRRKK